MIKELIRRRRRAVKVEIVCPHGSFIPGLHRLETSPSRYGCKHCGFTVVLSTHHDEVAW